MATAGIFIRTGRIDAQIQLNFRHSDWLLKAGILPWYLSPAARAFNVFPEYSAIS
jgi:hypothetical protein